MESFKTKGGEKLGRRTGLPALDEKPTEAPEPALAQNLRSELAPGWGGRALRTRRWEGRGLKLVGKPSRLPRGAEAAAAEDGGIGKEEPVATWVHVPGCGERPLGEERIPAFGSTNVRSNKKRHCCRFLLTLKRGGFEFVKTMRKDRVVPVIVKWGPGSVSRLNVLWKSIVWLSK